MSQDTLDVIYEAVLAGDANATTAAVNQALAEGITADAILNDACIPAMDEVGALFEEGEKFVPEMLISARAMGAVNTLVRDGDRWIGTNTDAEGLARSLDWAGTTVCPSCGGAFALEALDCRPPVARGRASLVLMDVGSTAIAEIPPGWRVVMRRVG